MGVVSLEVDHFEHDSDSVFELRGLDTNHVEVGAVRLRIGEVDGLPGATAKAAGSEITVSAGGSDIRQVSREQSQFIVTGPFAPAIDDFLRIADVSRLLSSEASISVALPAAETAQTTYSCSTAPVYLNTSPVAAQCCITVVTWMYGSALGTLFVDPSNRVVSRAYNPSNGAPCKSGSGGSCSGAACVFGPNGFAKPSLTSGTGYPKVYTDTSAGTCASAYYATPQTPEFSDVTGTFPTGRGCCANGTGPCGPGLAACSACGGSSGEGAWDY